MTAAYPLAWPEGWPRTSWDRRQNGSRFQTTFDRARRELLAELQRLGARNVVISSWLPLRADGAPRADAARRVIEDPGVAVYFTRGDRQIVMARDAYTSIHDNLRSIGLAVQHLRGLERHGGAAMMDRAFSGFAALEAPKRERHWSEVLGVDLDSEDWMIDAAYRHRAKTAHPDAGGSVELMAELNAAREQAMKGLNR